MHSSLGKHIENFFAKFDKLNKDSKTLIKYGSAVFYGVFIAGTVVFIYNRLFLGSNFQIELSATSIIKSSFFILAEVIIGSLAFDYMLQEE